MSVTSSVREKFSWLHTLTVGVQIGPERERERSSEFLCLLYLSIVCLCDKLCLSLRFHVQQTINGLMDARGMEKECAYPNLCKQRGRTVLWKLQRNKANEPYNKGMGKNY